MYLHIGRDCVINSKEVIGFFNLDYIKNTKEYRNMHKFLEDENKLYDISNTQEKTLILLENKKDIKAYISNMSANSISKRKM